MIPFYDMTHIEEVERQIYDNLQEVIRNKNFILGPFGTQFEAAWAQYLGVEHVVAVANGFDAITLCLQALLNKKSTVAVPAMTYAATAMAVHRAGMSVQFVDVNAQTGLMELTTSKLQGVDALLPVHLYGQAIDVSTYADQASLPVVYDGAQAHGTYTKGKRRHVAHLGNATTFSFYPSKNLGAFGDAGAIATNDAGLAEKLRWLRNQGQATKNVHLLSGFNSRMDEMQAAVLLAKLPWLNKWQQQRREAAAAYTGMLANIQGCRVLNRDATSDGWHLFVVLCDDRPRLRSYLEKQEIYTQIHYPTAVNRQPAFHGSGCENAKLWGERALSLPFWPGISQNQMHEVASVIRSFYS